MLQLHVGFPNMNLLWKHGFKMTQRVFYLNLQIAASIASDERIGLVGQIVISAELFKSNVVIRCYIPFFTNYTVKAWQVHGENIFCTKRCSVS